MLRQRANRESNHSRPLKVFVSYSRSDAQFADKLVARLEARGVVVSIDKRDLPMLEDWQRELLGLIRAADAIVFIITGRSVKSRICIWELNEAAKLNKRLAPILLEPVPQDDFPREVVPLHHVDFDPPNEFNAAADKLLEALLTDSGWVKEHTRLGELARRWDERSRGTPPLRGQDLPEAESWLALQPRAAPAPTALHRKLIAAARRAATRRQLLAVGGSLAVAAIASSLAGIAYRQREIAVENERNAAARRDQALISQSRFLADVARQQALAENFGTGLALALEALPDTGLGPERPYVPEAEVGLYGNVVGLTERAVLAHDVSVGGMSWIGPAGSGQDVATDDKMIQYSLDRLPMGAHIIAAMGGVSAVFSHDGSKIVTWGNDGARVWDTRTNRELAYLHPPALGVAAAAISPDGSLVVAAFPDHTARVWKTADWSESLNLKGHSALLTAVGFNPDGTRIVTASWDKTVRVWSARTGRQELVLAGHGEGASAVIFNRDGSRIITASYDKTIRVWDARTGAVQTVLSGHAEAVRRVEISPDGMVIVTAANDGTARLWDIGTAAQIRYLARDGAMDVDFSPDGGRVVIALNDGTSRIVEARSGADIAVLRGHGRAVLSAAFSPNGSQVVTASNDGSARLWDSQTGRHLRTFAGHVRGVFGAIFSPDGASVATMSFDGTARLWQAESARLARPYDGEPELADSSDLSPNGDRRLSIGSDHNIAIADARTGARLTILKGHKGTVFGAAFSRDGSQVVTASYDATARIWDSRSGRAIAVLRGHEGSVLSAAFSLDGARIVTGSSDRTARIWDIRTRATVATIGTPGYDVAHVGFSSDGTRVITLGQDRKGDSWPFFADTQRLVDFARAWLPRCLTPDERKRFFLDPEPPTWCITGVHREQSVDPSLWIGKWPYQSKGWKDWLMKRTKAREGNMP